MSQIPSEQESGPRGAPTHPALPHVPRAHTTPTTPIPSPLPDPRSGPATHGLTFSRSKLPRSFSRQLMMTLAAREQFLSGSPRLSNKVSKRLMS